MKMRILVWAALAVAATAGLAWAQPDYKAAAEHYKAAEAAMASGDFGAAALEYGVAYDIGVVFGVFMYFPTLVEVPIAKMFLSLGMHPGPLIAYLMSDPELSLQSILITAAIIGKLRAWAYVGLVALFSTLAGLTYGAWVDGSSLILLAAGIVGFISLIVGSLHLLELRRQALKRS